MPLHSGWGCLCHGSFITRQELTFLQLFLGWHVLHKSTLSWKTDGSQLEDEIFSMRLRNTFIMEPCSAGFLFFIATSKGISAVFFLKSWDHAQSLPYIDIWQRYMTKYWERWPIIWPNNLRTHSCRDSGSGWFSVLSEDYSYGLGCSSAPVGFSVNVFFVFEIVLKTLFSVSLSRCCKVGGFCDFFLPSYENFNCWIKISCRFVSLLSPLKVLSLQTWGWWRERQVRALNPVFDIIFLFPSPKEYPELSPNCKNMQ